MDDGLVLELCKTENHRRIVLILVVVENGPVPYCQICNDLIEQAILILVVVENGLVRRMYHFCILWNLGLNPCCSGRWSRTLYIYSYSKHQICLNPCCSGRWSRTECFKMFRHLLNSLNPCCSGRWTRTFRTLLEFVMEKSVLILVVVDDGLVLDLIRHY